MNRLLSNVVEMVTTRSEQIVSCSFAAFGRVSINVPGPLAPTECWDRCGSRVAFARPHTVAYYGNPYACDQTPIRMQGVSDLKPMRNPFSSRQYVDSNLRIRTGTDSTRLPVKMNMFLVVVVAINIARTSYADCSLRLYIRIFHPKCMGTTMD